MQTFLPYFDVNEIAKCLDYRRLGKQRVECKQILMAIENRKNNIGGGWVNHPATLMWVGHSKALTIYALAMCAEWKRRGYQDSLTPEFEKLLSSTPDTGNPSWWGDEIVSISHRSNLLRKDYGYYSMFGWNVPTTLEYVWPKSK